MEILQDALNTKDSAQVTSEEQIKGLDFKTARLKTQQQLKVRFIQYL